MKRRAAVVIAGFGGTLLGLGAVASCGSRTGLPLDETADAEPEHGLLSLDQFAEEPEPMGKDVVREDTLPGLDVNRPDVPVFNPCPDAAATLIYVIGKSGMLYSFDPGASTFTTIGTISCPGSPAAATPFSMAVDREGVAYVGFSEPDPTNANNEIGTGLYRVSTKTASCTATSYDEAKNGMYTFGMGFVANAPDAGSGEAGPLDQLFISLDVGGISANGLLAMLDTTTFTLTKVGYFHPMPGLAAAELTGTGDGRLFAFSPGMVDGTSFIAEVDPGTAKIKGASVVPGVVQGSGWAFGFWRNAFYTFTTSSQTDPTTVVHKFDPTAMTAVLVAMNPDTIVGAGVSTCAPTSL